MTWPLIKFFLLSLAFVGAFAAALRVLAPKLKARGRHLQVLEAVSLGGGKSLALVRVGERTLLFSVTGKDVALVSETDIVPQGAETEAAAPPPLLAWIGRVRKGEGGFADLAERLKRLRRFPQ